MRTNCSMLLCVSAIAVRGYSWQLGPEGRLGTKPSDVTFAVRARNGQFVFRTGETIHLELSFTSSAVKKYLVDVSEFERVDVFGFDHVEVEPPSGWEDPFRNYFRFCPSFWQGGLQNAKELSPDPTIVDLELNSWIRFKRPGEYRVTVRSERVSRLNAANRGELVSLRSNSLMLRIVAATEAWQQRMIEGAVRTLDRPRVSTDPPRARWEAAETLRNLGSVAAVQEMARRMKNGNAGYDFISGLAGSPAREATLDEMKTLLLDPPFPVDSKFICAMAVAALPGEATAQTRALQLEFETRFREELRLALRSKRGRALAVSSQTVNSIR